MGDPNRTLVTYMAAVSSLKMAIIYLVPVINVENGLNVLHIHTATMDMGGGYAGFSIFILYTCRFQLVEYQLSPLTK